MGFLKGSFPLGLVDPIWLAPSRPYIRNTEWKFRQSNTTECSCHCSCHWSLFPVFCVRVSNLFLVWIRNGAKEERRTKETGTRLTVKSKDEDSLDSLETICTQACALVFPVCGHALFNMDVAFRGQLRKLLASRLKKSVLTLQVICQCTFPIWPGFVSFISGRTRLAKARPLSGRLSQAETGSK